MPGNQLPDSINRLKEIFGLGEPKPSRDGMYDVICPACEKATSYSRSDVVRDIVGLEAPGLDCVHCGTCQVVTDDQKKQVIDDLMNRVDELERKVSNHSGAIYNR